MDYFTTTSKTSNRATDCLIIGIYDGGKLSAGARDVDSASKGAIRRLLKSGDLSAKKGRTAVLTSVAGVKAKRIVVVGLGKSRDFGAKEFRDAVAAATQAISTTKAKQVLNSLTLEKITGTSAYYLARHSAEAIGDTLYSFDQMKSGRKPKRSELTKAGFVIRARGDAADTMRGAQHGGAIVTGKSLAKDLGNLPANVCTPGYLARTAKKLAVGNGRLTVRVLNEAEMKRLRMDSLLSVTAGTVEPAKLIVMQYKGAGREQPIVL
ncbi:MAG: leucyl aminopeptidase, partial [Woeseiaceae bacterium]|nr:leucyl aminopeptidase [Woeseiaceae bacterium]